MNNILFSTLRGFLLLSYLEAPVEGTASLKGQRVTEA